MNGINLLDFKVNYLSRKAGFKVTMNRLKSQVSWSAWTTISGFRQSYFVQTIMHFRVKLLMNHICDSLFTLATCDRTPSSYVVNLILLQARF